MRENLFIGTSGWSYPHWKSFFYQKVPQKDWLTFYAQTFNSVEINATFYRLQSTKTFKRWHDTTPGSFHFCIKGNRYLTHNKKLIDPLPSIMREQERAQQLGYKLDVVLWQLPENVHQKNIARLVGFCEALQHWSEVRHAIEFRHVSWFESDVADCLRQYGVAVCQSDAADWPMWEAVTTDLVYIRLHGHRQTYVSSYTKHELEYFAERIRQWLSETRKVYVYFDNDAEGNAPRDALRLMELI